MKPKWSVIGGVLLGTAVLGSAGAWYARNRTVVWAVSEPGLRSLPASDSVRGTGTPWAPWDQPDLSLRWLDPWSGSDPLVTPLSGPLPSGLLAFEVLGLLSPLGVSPGGWEAWTAALDGPRGPVVPLAVAGKSDAELLSLLLWFSASPVPDAEASLDPSGGLRADHPWRAAVEEMKSWTARGRLAANWWEYSDSDVKAAVAEGRARWGLAWSGVQFTGLENGIQQTSFHVAPPRPGSRSLNLTGRWLLVRKEGGWGDGGLTDQALKTLSSVESSQRILSSLGLVLAGDGPSVNQDSKALDLAVLSAGALVAAPAPGADLSRWHGVLEAVRVELRR